MNARNRILPQSRQKVTQQFRISPQDTGSIQVQIALLTERIKMITEHLEKNPKDVSSKRGLLQAVEQRRTFLAYLQRENSEEYKALVKKLGLRK